MVAILRGVRRYASLSVSDLVDRFWRPRWISVTSVNARKRREVLLRHFTPARFSIVLDSLISSRREARFRINCFKQAFSVRCSLPTRRTSRMLMIGGSLRIAAICCVLYRTCIFPFIIVLRRSTRGAVRPGAPTVAFWTRMPGNEVERDAVIAGSSRATDLLKMIGKSGT